MTQSPTTSLAAPGRALMICGHGSRDEQAVREFRNLSDQLRARLTGLDVEFGFLEFARPIIREGLDALISRGARDILAVPGMLFAAGHAKNDIPSVLNTYLAQKRADGLPDLTLRYGRELGIDLKMIRAAGDRVAQAVEAADQHLGEVPRHETLLVVVGRGASDPDANSNVAKVARMLWEGMGFGWCETAYSGVTFPLVAPALEHAAKLGYRRIVVFPYFLFTGVLVRRIYEHTDAVAAAHPELQFIKASYLNDHPLVLDSFVERAQEILDGMSRSAASVIGFPPSASRPAFSSSSSWR